MTGDFVTPCEESTKSKIKGLINELSRTQQGAHIVSANKLVPSAADSKLIVWVHRVLVHVAPVQAKRFSLVQGSQTKQLKRQQAKLPALTQGETL